LFIRDIDLVPGRPRNEELDVEKGPVEYRHLTMITSFQVRVKPSMYERHPEFKAGVSLQVSVWHLKLQMKDGKGIVPFYELYKFLDEHHSFLIGSAAEVLVSVSRLPKDYCFLSLMKPSSREKGSKECGYAFHAFGRRDPDLSGKVALLSVTPTLV
jgi:hypothetical protein